MKNHNNDTSKWAKELAYAVKISLEESSEDRKRAGEDRKLILHYIQKMDRQNHLIGQVLTQVIKVGNKIISKVDENTKVMREVLHYLKLGGNGRYNGNNHRRRN